MTQTREKPNPPGIVLSGVRRLLGAALVIWREHTLTRGEFIALSHSPEVVKKRLEYAKLPGGWRDRDALDKLVGLL